MMVLPSSSAKDLPVESAGVLGSRSVPAASSHEVLGAHAPSGLPLLTTEAEDLKEVVHSLSFVSIF